MTQKDKEKPGLIDFPLDPTPSLEAYKKFTKHIDEYIAMFSDNNGVLSIGPIMLGTLDRPFITAPIEMDPREIERHLRRTTDILERAIEEAKKLIKYTRKIIDQTGSVSPEAEKRIQVVEKIVGDIQGLLCKYNGFAWHPRCYERIRTLVQSSFRPGEPGIPIQITILV
jgi:hypothetical protein